MVVYRDGDFRKLGTLFWGSLYDMLGSILWPPIPGNYELGFRTKRCRGAELSFHSGTLLDACRLCLYSSGSYHGGSEDGHYN